MKVLVADSFEQSGLQGLREAGCDVVYDASLEGDSLRNAVAMLKPQVLIVRSTLVGESTLAAGSELGLVVRAGAGYNTIDVAEASKRSIFVSNCPGKNAVAVAELVFGLILALDRRIVDNTVDLRNHRWNKKEYSLARGVKSRTLGIVGMGQTGQAVALRARAFDMHIVAWSRSLTRERAEAMHVIRCESIAEVAQRCDVFTIHLPASPETKGAVSAAVIDQLRPGAIFINTARSDIVDSSALQTAVLQRGLRVGLDVFPDEPTASTGLFSCAIMHSGGVVYGTHHIGASTDQAQESIAAETVRIVATFRSSGQVIHCVNLRSKVRAHSRLRVRHINRPGVLAHVLHEVSHAKVNVEEMENVICDGDASACAQILLDAPLSDEVLSAIRNGNSNVLAVTQTALA